MPEPLNPGALTPPLGQCPARLHRTRMAAAILTRSAATMQSDRARGRCKIPVVKIGRTVAYREADLLAFVESCRVEG
jgi:hypothetical protein